MNKYIEKKLEGTSYVPLNQGIIRHTKNTIDLYIWSDQHFGSNECNYDLAAGIIKEIKENRNALTIMGGDTIEAIPRGYKIDSKEQEVPPDTQIVLTKRYLLPIKNKIVCMYKGNHNTQARGESIDSDFLIADALGVPYKTVPTVVQLKTPKGTVKIAGGHGRSSAKNGDLELEKLRNIYPDCHIYHLGHNHMLYAKHIGALYFDEEGKEQWQDSWFSRTGNCLNYAEYARYALYAPQRSGCVKFEIRNGKVTEGIVLTSDYFGV